MNNKDLAAWWRRERGLLRSFKKAIAEAQKVASPSDFDATDPKLKYVLPIRGVLGRLSQRLGPDADDLLEYTFLTASIEAGLDFARKLRHQRQRKMAYLTAVSRFDTLLGKLGILESANFHNGLGLITEILTRPKIPLEGAVSTRDDLFDPAGALSKPDMTLYEGLDRLLYLDRRIVCLIGDPLTGKTSFLQAVLNGSKQPNKRRGSISVDLDPEPKDKLTVSTYIARFLDAADKSAGKSGVTPVEQHSISAMLDAAVRILRKSDNVEHIWYIDNIDSLIVDLDDNDALKLMHFIVSLAAAGILRVFMTATDYRVVRETAIRAVKDGTVASLNTDAEDESWWDSNCAKAEIPNWKGQIDQLLDVLDTREPLIFAPYARARICDYSGGFVYMIKVIVRALLQMHGPQLDAIGVKEGDVEVALDVLINEPSHGGMKALHDEVFGKLNKVYDSMSETERFILTSMVKQPELTIAKLTDEQHSQNVASLETSLNLLEKRAYLKKQESSPDEYVWNIYLWKLYMETKVKYPTDAHAETIFRIDMANRCLHVGKRTLPLSRTQLKLLNFLHAEGLKSPDEGVSSISLSRRVFKPDAKSDSQDDAEDIELAIGWIERRVKDLVKEPASEEYAELAGNPTPEMSALILPPGDGSIRTSYRLNLAETSYTPDPLIRPL